MICGASGFIGRNLFEYFNSLENYDVYGTYLKNRPQSPYPGLVQADLKDKEKTLRATQDMNVVINCAAMTDGMGVYNPATYILPNIQINQNLIEAALINRVRHFIFLSCTVMYPSSSRPLKEHEHNLENVHPKYIMPARMKLVAEDLCRICANLGNTKYTVVRHTNVYGPYDKFDLQKGHVLSATIEKVMRAEKEITVWGSGTESRDFLYIQDLIRFVEAVIEKQENNFDIFNVGYGQTYSVNELVDHIIRCSGKKISAVHDLNKPTIETLMKIDVEKAKNILGWKADVGLSEGLVQTIDWYTKNQGKDSNQYNMVDGNFR